MNDHEIVCERERETGAAREMLQSLASLSFFHGRLIQGSFTIRVYRPSPLAPKTAWLLTAYGFPVYSSFDWPPTLIEHWYRKLHIFFGHLLTLPSGVPPTLFTWHFCFLLFAFRHSCIPSHEIHELTGLSKVKM